MLFPHAEKQRRPERKTWFGRVWGQKAGTVERIQKFAGHPVRHVVRVGSP
jgi:hypothetical protein